MKVLRLHHLAHYLTHVQKWNTTIFLSGGSGEKVIKFLYGDYFTVEGRQKATFWKIELGSLWQEKLEPSGKRKMQQGMF